MKPKFSLVLIAFLVSFSINAYAKKDTGKSGKETVVFSVPMDCMSCKNKIEKNIAFEKGVTDLKIDFSAQTVSVTFKVDKSSVENLVAAFKKLGFNAVVINENGTATQTSGSL